MFNIQKLIFLFFSFTVVFGATLRDAEDRNTFLQVVDEDPILMNLEEETDDNDETLSFDLMPSSTEEFEAESETMTDVIQRMVGVFAKANWTPHMVTNLLRMALSSILTMYNGGYLPLIANAIFVLIKSLVRS